MKEDLVRKVFIDILPRRGNYVDWNSSLGYKVEFIYDDIEGYIEILEYNNKKLKVKYKDKIKLVNVDVLTKCKIGKFIEAPLLRNDVYQYSVGETLQSKHSKIKLLEKIRIGDRNLKGYIYKCEKCGNVDQIAENNLSKNGCKVCCVPSKKILVGYNDLWTTHPEVASLLECPKQGYELTHGSHKRLNFICPRCSSKIKNKQIPNVITYGLTCNQCSDAVSYPEKVMFSILSQLNLEFETQKIFNWSKGKRYDFYIPSDNSIIEVHGNQHFGKGFSKLGGKTLKEEQKNDRIKEELAKDNGIKNYIVIDCARSEFKYIQNSILQSEITKLYNLSKINFVKCHEYACGTLVKIASDLWNNGHKASEIGVIMKIKSNTTVLKYLKDAATLGWCDYDSRKVMRSVGKQNNYNKSRAVVQLTPTGEYIDEFKSKTYASKKLGIYLCGITQVCEGKRDYVKGYKFMYKEDYDKLSKKAL